MGTQKDLVITDDVNLRTYTYYSYLDAIIANDYRTGNIAAKIRIPGYGKYEWKFISKRLDMEENKDIIIFKTKQFNADMNAWLYRDLANIDEFELIIDYQQYSQPWGNISVFISEEDIVDLGTPLLLKYGYMNRVGRFYKEENGEIERLNNKEISDGFKIIKKATQLLIINEFGVEKIIHKVDLKDKEYKIGVAVNLYDNQYFPWLFVNHMIWKYNKNDRGIMLEFDSTIQRNWTYYTINNFVDYRIQKVKIVRKLGISVLDYIKCQIDEDCYVEMLLDSYDLIDTYYYHRKHFWHQCLLYGYDEEEQSIKVLCTDGGKLRRALLMYEDFLIQSDLFEDDENIVSQEYNPEKEVYDIDLKKYLTLIKKYIENHSAIDTDTIVPREEYYYGFSVYDAMQKDKDKILLLEDRRISHLIYEHKRIMADSLEYLVIREFLTYEEVKEILTALKELIDMAICLRDYALLFQRKKDGKIVNRAYELLNKMRDFEKETYLNLITLIETKMV